MVLVEPLVPSEDLEEDLCFLEFNQLANGQVQKGDCAEDHGAVVNGQRRLEGWIAVLAIGFEGNFIVKVLGELLVISLEFGGRVIVEPELGVDVHRWADPVFVPSVKFGFFLQEIVKEDEATFIVVFAVSTDEAEENVLKGDKVKLPNVLGEDVLRELET